jgi:hypothetical protein
MGVYASPIDTKPIGNTEEILEKRYEETMARLQKMKDAVYTVDSTWVCEI